MVKRLTNKFLNEMKNAVEISNKKELEQRIQYIDKIRKSKEIKDVVNWSLHVGSVLNESLNIIPYEVLRENSHTLLYENKTNQGDVGNVYIYTSGVWNEENLGHKCNFSIAEFNLNGGYPSHESICFVFGKDGIVKSGGNLGGGFIYGRNYNIKGYPMYLKRHLEKQNVDEGDFLDKVSGNLIKLAEKGRNKDLVLRSTLRQLEVFPDEWILENLKGK